MRILVFPHSLEIGGSQINAIELGATIRDLGHEVTVMGDPGPLTGLIDSLGLEFVPLDGYHRRPAPALVRQIRELVRTRSFDIVHGYEWPPALEAAAATFRDPHAAAVCTIMSMAVAPFLPARMPLVVGTEALREHTAARRPGPVYLIEPPVDVRTNAPGFPVEDFRRTYGLDGDFVDIAVVSRLVPELKLEGVLTAIDVIGELGATRPVRLIVAGDGTARAEVQSRADAANARAGRRAVVLTGELRDPRPAYAAADVMLGMGSSALRALSFGRPLVVQGERGFWELLTPDTVDLFLHQGWYGLGDGTGGAERLRAALLRLLDDPILRAKLGQYGRDLAVERFSLQHAADVQLDIYRAALTGRRSGLSTMAGSAAGLLAYKINRKYEALRGTQRRDDFNAATLAQSALKR
ncbi:glycosyltransferase family 4 protein [Symbioplanes lichenis]|uniref:glycosyltransferase family 4 protein n=1 Tax=Symbioplanes lichenis TaxID=1629072 RepID=UPI00273A054F|nr:glycosyltransferase family 4 protein [Actinoplanes lichenis]